MPDRDDVEALLDLRTALLRVKMIVISGNAQELLPIAQGLGTHRTFAKPFGSQEVIAAVDDLLTEISS